MSCISSEPYLLNIKQIFSVNEWNLHKYLYLLTCINIYIYDPIFNLISLSSDLLNFVNRTVEFNFVGHHLV